MITLFHGSSELFDHFDLSHAGESTGVKFGFGVYLSESEASAVHYSVPRHGASAPDHYLYTVEIPDLTADNHLFSSRPVAPVIVAKVEEALGAKAPEEAVAKGKLFRKWVGCTLTGAAKCAFPEEKAAAEFLDRLGVIYNVWPKATTIPDGLKNIAVFNADRVHIVRREHIDVMRKGDKNVLVEGSKREV